MVQNNYNHADSDVEMLGRVSECNSFDSSAHMSIIMDDGDDLTNKPPPPNNASSSTHITKRRRINCDTSIRNGNVILVAGKHAMKSEQMHRSGAVIGITPGGMAKSTSEVIDICSVSTRAPTSKIQTQQSLKSSDAPGSRSTLEYRGYQSSQLAHGLIQANHTATQRVVQNQVQFNQGVTRNQRQKNDPVQRNKTEKTKMSSQNQPLAGWKPPVNQNEHMNPSAVIKHDEVAKGFEYEQEDCLIRTPGGRVLKINRFIMKVDLDLRLDNKYAHPCKANAAIHDAGRCADLFRLENHIDPRSFHLALPSSTPLERFRMQSVMSMLRCCTKWKTNPSTIHYAVNNLHRVIIARTRKEPTLTEELFTGTTMACIRMALKHEETANFNRLWQNQFQSIWEACGFNPSSFNHLTVQKINAVEYECARVLEHPMMPPSPLDFLDRYLTVGGWPKKYIAEYGDLAHYFIDLSLFAPKMEGLVECQPSLLSAAALALSVKIWSAMEKHQKYEHWPQRLEAYTGYDYKSMKPVIASLSQLVREKPHGEELLKPYHTTWATTKWK